MNRVRKQIGVEKNKNLTGQNVVVAVLDTGMEEHPDLRGKVILFHDFLYEKNKPYDDNGHGTHVCGIIGGNGALSNGLYCGIAPDVKFCIGKILNNRGEGDADTLIRALDWIEYNYKKYAIKVLNISVSMKGLKDKDKERLVLYKLERLWNLGMIVVTAAGNDGPANDTISEIGESSKVITVGCYDEEYFANDKNKCSSYSARGRNSLWFRKPDIVAPGTHIVSCNAFYTKRKSQYVNPYIDKSGTSMATAIVTAVIALILESDKNITNMECKQILLRNVKELNLPWNQQGWGLVQASNILEKSGEAF